MFEQCRVAKRYVSCLRWIFRFDLATICLAFAFVFFGVGASMAHPGPTILFLEEIPSYASNPPRNSYSAKTPYTVIIGFDEEIQGFGLEDIEVRHVDAPRHCQPIVSNLLEEKRRWPDTPAYRYYYPERAGKVFRHFFGIVIKPDGPFDIDLRIGDRTTGFQVAEGAHAGFQFVRPRQRTIGYRGTGPFAVPVANAGHDQTVSSGTMVTLEGTGSTEDCSKNLTYTWTRTGGTGDNGVVLTSGNTAYTSQLNFTTDDLAPGAADETHVFELVVTDDEGTKSVADTVTVTVTAPLDLPGPDADAGGDQTVSSGAMVELDGSGSTTDERRTIASWAWTRTGGTGSSVTLNDASAAQPSFTADTLEAGAADVTHVFTLTVTDSAGKIDTDTVMVTVTAPFADPVVEVGPDQTVGSGEMVELDGSGSTVDRRRTIASYAWTRTSGTGGSVTLNDASAAQPGFTADTLSPGADDVTHVFELTVADSVGETDTDTVMVTVTAPFAVPVAEAGSDQTVGSGEMVELDGSGSTVDRRRTITSYAWTRTGGTGGSVTLNDASAAQSGFTADTLSPGADDVTHVFELIVTDSAGEIDTDTVKVTIIAPIAVPVAEAGPDQTFGSGEMVELDGSGSTVDRRRTITSYAWTRTSGTGGLVTLNDASAARPGFTADTLSPGADDVTHVFKLTVADSAGEVDTDTVIVTVIAPFAVPVAEAGPDQTVGSGAMVQLDGSGSTSDRRRNIASYAWRLRRISPENIPKVSPVLTGADTARPRFTADLLSRGADDVTHVFELVVTDNKGAASVVDTVTVTVDAPNASPVADAGPDQMVGSGDPVQLNGSDSFDRDGRITTYLWTPFGRSSTTILTGANTARPSFTAVTLEPGDPDVTHSFSLFVKDNEGAYAVDTVRVTITAPNVPPVADAGPDQRVSSGVVARLDGSGSSDSDGTIVFHNWIRTGGTSRASVTLDNPSWRRPSFTADILAPDADDVTHVFTLVVRDNEGVIAIDTVTVTVTPPNLPPVADGGPNRRVASGATVTLDGSGSSDSDGTIVLYRWKRWLGTGDPAVVLTGENTEQLSFIADTLAPGADDVYHAFSLTVRDNEGVDDRDSDVVVWVTAPNVPPVADAGEDQTVASGAEVRLDGGGSSGSDSTIANYVWTRTGGSGDDAVVLTGADTEQPRFTADTLVPGADDVTHVFSLIVMNDEGDTSNADTVTVTINAPNEPPIADAGPDQTVGSGTIVELDGSGSNDSDGTIGTFSWLRTGGTGTGGVVLTGADSAQPSFMADTLPADADDVTHLFELVVTDNEGAASVADTVTVTVTAGNVPPIADAGPDQTATSGAMVELDGRRSMDSDGTIESYVWTRTGGTIGASVTLSDASAAQPSFAADALSPGADNVTHVFTLVVMDDEGDTSVADTVTVTVTAPFAAPVAQAGDDVTVGSGAKVQLDGSGSTVDRRRTIASWAWTRTGGIGSSVTLNDATAAQPSFTADTLSPGADDVTFVFTLVVMDDEGDTSVADTVTVAVTAPFAVPVAQAGDDVTVGSGAKVQLDGSGSTVDRRRIIASWAWTRTGGTGRSVTLNDATAAQPSFTADALSPGAVNVTHVFTLVVTDDEGDTSVADTLTVTVAAPNAPPVAEAGDDVTVGSGTLVQLVGSGSLDPDGQVASYAWTRTGGSGDSTIVLNGAYWVRLSFTADTLSPDADDVTHLFELVVTDNEGAVSVADTVTVTVTVTARNMRPIADAGEDQRVGSGDPVQLNGSDSFDRDGRITTYLWTPFGRSGTTILTGANTARPSFTAVTLEPGDPDVTHSFSLFVKDNEGAYAVDTVRVTITAPNVPPVADAGPDQRVSSGVVAWLDGSGSSDSDGTIVFHNWIRTGGTSRASVTLDNPSWRRPSFTADILAPDADDVTHVFTLVVRDNEGVIAIDTVTVTVTPPNLPPVADGGPNRRVASGATVTLDGSGSSDSDGTIVLYRWKRWLGTGDPAVVLTGENTEQLSFIADTLAPGADDVYHAFSLTVRDNEGVDDRDSDVVVWVTAPNVPPVADAGEDQTVASGAEVRLDGGGSSGSDSTIANYVWARTGGSGDDAVVLTGADTGQPQFTADTLAPGAADVTHIFELTVTDSAGEIDTDTVMVTVIAPNAVPVADAGPDRTVGSGAMVELDGSRSNDSDGTIGTYSWLRTGGTGTGGVVLTGADTARPNFTADTLPADANDVTHVFTLTVTDDAGGTSTDTVEVTVTAGNVPPVADAGEDQTVASGAMVELDGSRSTDGDGTISSYVWTRTGGTGGSVTLNNASASAAQPGFRADTLSPGADDVTHVFELAVTDSAGATDTDTVLVTVTAPFAAPVAEAGDDQTVGSGTIVQLDGSGSTSDRRRSIASYAWTRTSGTGGSVTPNNATAARSGFTADTLSPGADDVTHVFELVVTDSAGEIDIDTVMVTVTAPFAVPVAEAGDDLTVASGAMVQLDGSGSTSDRRRNIASWAWTRTGGTGGSVTLNSTTAARPSFTADTLSPGVADVTHVFSLVVRDDEGDTSVADTVTVMIIAPNAALFADAGPDRTVASGTMVQLVGIGYSDPDGKVASYVWTRAGGTGDSKIVLTGANSARLGFTADTLSPGADDVTHVFELVVANDSGLASVADTVTVTVTAGNVPPVADAGPDRTVASGAMVHLDGSGSSDSDGMIASYSWKARWRLTSADTVRPSFRAYILYPGEGDVTHVFELVVTDDEGRRSVADTVTVTVTAAPIADAGPDQTVGSGTWVQLDGGASFDRGGMIASYRWDRIDGSGHRVVLTGADTAKPSFTADTLSPDADDVTHAFALVVTDDSGLASVADIMTVTVTAGNVPPVADAGPDQTVGSGDPVQLNGRDSFDSDGTIATYFWVPDSAAELTGANTARPSFTTDTLEPGDPDVIHRIELYVRDNEGAFAVDTVKVTVTAPNVPPVADAGPDQRVRSGGLAWLNGSGSSDSDGTIASYYWTRTGGTSGASVTLDYPSWRRPSFTADTLSPGADDVTHVFLLIVTDNESVSSVDTVTVTVTAPFVNPVADAGDDRTVASGTTVTFDGSRSRTDHRRNIASYAWVAVRWPGGPRPVLNGADTARPTFTPTLAHGAADALYAFWLKVTDDGGAVSANDTVTITVTSPINDLVAEAGDNRTVASGATVQLDGSGSTSDSRRTIFYDWTRTSGSGGAVTLSGADTATPSFTADTLTADTGNVTQVFTLTVTDDQGSTAATDTVTITITSPIKDLVAEAGDNRTVASGATVQLDGSGSTSDSRGTISYDWERTSGSGGAVTLSDADTATPSFTADRLTADTGDVTQVFTLTVTDDQGSTAATDTVTITITSPIKDLVAEAGDNRTVASGATVQLDGSGSTSDSRRTISYDWARTSGSGGAVTLSDADTATPSFTADTLTADTGNVTQVFTLTVTDDQGSTAATDTVTITITSPIKDLVAEAGDNRTVASGATVQLDGSGSTSDSRRTISYDWKRTSGSGGAVTLSDADTAMPSFTADTLTADTGNVTQVFTLTVTDDQGSTAATDTVTITITSPIKGLVAEAGDNRTVASGATVQLDGSGSTSDSRGTISYDWERTSGSGGAVTLTGASTGQPSFTADTLIDGAEDVTHVFTLTVMDSAGDTSTDTVTITVAADFLRPVADAGSDQTVDSGDNVQLDGSGSTSDRRSAISYAWKRTGGSGDSTIVLDGAKTARPTFTAETLFPDSLGRTHIFTLTVTDDNGNTSTDTVYVVVSSPTGVPIHCYPSSPLVYPVMHPNVRPVADAGPDLTVSSAKTLIVDGSASMDPDGMIVAYQWYQWTDGRSRLRTSALSSTPRLTLKIDPSLSASDHTLVFCLVVWDNEGVRSFGDTVTVTVTTTILPPDADAGEDQTVASGAMVQLDGSGSTSDHRRTIASYAWTRTGGTEGATVALTGADTVRSSFTADTLADGAEDVTHEFTLAVTNDVDETSTDTVTVTVTSGFAVPVADGGSDQSGVASGTIVTLDGTGSTVDRRRTITSYAWERTSGTGGSVTLSDSSAEQPSFTADALANGAEDVTHVFTLTVTDSAGDTDTDTVTVTVASGFENPVADAGDDQVVLSGAMVALDGGGSTTDRRRSFDYVWTRTGGTSGASVTLSDASAAQPSFAADSLVAGANDVTHIFTLTVTDDAGETSTDTVTVTVEAPFTAPLETNLEVPVEANLAAPVANAGEDQVVLNGTMVVLDGNGSTDSDGMIESHAWIRIGGTSNHVPSTVVFDPGILIFKAEPLTGGDADVTHVFELTVTNSAGETDTDMVTVTVISGFANPVADAGDDQVVLSGESVHLDGRNSSDLDGNIVTYTWTNTGETGDSLALSGADTAQPSFTADTLAAGAPDVTHVFSLTVTDDAGRTSTDTVTVIVEAPLETNLAAPVANAGEDQVVLSGTMVVLDGSGSTDSHGTIESHAWNRTGGTSNYVPSTVVTDPGTLLFKAESLTGGDDDVTHVFELTVTNSAGETDTDMVMVTVTSGFANPVADAGDDQVVLSGETVHLDGRNSSDFDGNIVTYTWTKTGGTGDSVALSGADTAQPSFTADTLAAGAPDVTHVFSLTVTDEAGNESEAEIITVTVMAPNAIQNAVANIAEAAPQEVAAEDVDILVSKSELTVQEGGWGVYQVRLGQSPGQNVVVEAFSAHEDIALEKQRFTFTVENWNRWQDVRVNTVADSDTENDHAEIRHRFVSDGVTPGLSEFVAVTLRDLDLILSPVGNYLTSRATALLNNQPGSSNFLKQDEITPDESNEFTFQATEGRLTLVGGFVRNGVWGEVIGSYVNNASGDTKSVLASFGVHRKFSENLLAGAMLQFDLADQALAGQTGTIDGVGWLVGPYFAARHNTQPLYFEGRLLYGQSENEIRFNDSALGVRTGSFDTTRLLAQLRMEGEVALMDRKYGPHLIPYVDASWIEEKAAAFTDTIGNRVPGQKVSIGQFEMGSNVEIPIAVSHGAMTLTGGLGLVYSNTEGDQVPSGSHSRGRGEIGVSIDLDENVDLEFESFFDGIGSSGYEGYGVSLSAEIRF